jgi:acyl transferase domain-containing protein/NAD(P)-dependent dehydrogenase (short-subunit alcohol dehydrogenase family)
VGAPGEGLVAVVGLGCVFPKARNVEEFWRNVVTSRDCISEIPRERLDQEAYYDPDPRAPDKTYCKVGGVIEELPFDSRAFRIPPATARVMDRAQKLCLLAATEAFRDAGCEGQPSDRARTAVIVGHAAGRMEAEEKILYRAQLWLLGDHLRRRLREAGVDGAIAESLVDQVAAEIRRELPAITEDSFVGICPNVTAARVASFLDLHGPNFVVDAACASSLAAVDCAIEGLAAGDFDFVLAGGCQAHLGVQILIGFSKFQGLSRDAIKPFDAKADGFVIGEGAGFFALKRLADAERDGNRIYAVIRGVGGSSDGREKGIGAPNPKAQVLAMRRAFDAAGYTPDTVQFVEAHASGTSVGDPAEVQAMTDVFGPHVKPGQRIGIGSVKSQIGHLMGGAGAAGLMRLVLALYHKTLPPTLHHTEPDPAIPWDRIPFYVVTEPEPWPQNQEGIPRRGNVSSFGYGGNNFHAAVEEYAAPYHRALLAAASSGTRRREPVAVVGAAAILPGAKDVDAYWANLMGRTSAIGEIPRDRWSGRSELFLDSDPNQLDKSNARFGGFTEHGRFDGARFRIPPATARLLDPTQQQQLEAADRILERLNSAARPLNRTSTAVFSGDPGGCRESTWKYVLRCHVQHYLREWRRVASAAKFGLEAGAVERIAALVAEDAVRDLPPVTEDANLSCSTSIGPARICKSFDFMGPHMSVDAACGSSLAALYVAIRGLQAGKWEVALVGCVGGMNTPEFSVAAAKARALSGTGSRPFDQSADGFVPGEGVVSFAVKRLRDAISDQDRILAVVRGVGSSSDGRGHSMYAPDAQYQAVAMRRAYEEAGVPPESVQYIECHATSTPVGDPAELAALNQVFAGKGRIGIGSVKAQLGHTLGAAGAAGMLKVMLGLEHRKLPPMPRVAKPLAELDPSRSPFYVVTEDAPWEENRGGEPRRAAVNAFGFGGTNWHVVLEEYRPDYHAALLAGPPERCEPALVAVGAPEWGELVERLPALVDQAGCWRGQPVRFAAAGDSPEDARRKLELAARTARPGKRNPALDAQGVYCGEGPRPAGLLAFLFPGQGPQYADMLHELYDRFGVVRETFAEANDALGDLLGAPLEGFLFTSSAGAGQRAEVDARMAERSDLTQPALLAANIALFRLLDRFGLAPDVVAGHSLGEYAALSAAGVLDFRQALRAVWVRGREFPRLAEQQGDPGKMAMASAPAETVAPVLAAVPGYVTVANRNCRFQTVISGETRAVEVAVEALTRQGVECRVLPIAGAFHSAIARAIREPMAEAVARLQVRPPRVRVFSSVDGAEYTTGANLCARVTANLLDQLERPVDFVGLIETLYAAGARTFLETGPKNALTGFVADILGERPHHALFVNHPKHGERTQLHRLLAQLITLGFEPDLEGPDRTPVKPAEVRPPAPAECPPVQATQPVRRHPQPGGAREPIVISGAAVGLPGRVFRVFSEEGLERLFAGQSLIDPIPPELQDRIVQKGITRLVKGGNGETSLEEVRNREGSVKLAGQRGRFSLKDDYGLDEDWLTNADVSYQLAVAAGIEGLRDAGIPLQLAYRKTSTGISIPSGWVLPEPLQDETAVLFASAYPGHGKIVDEVGRFYASKFGPWAAEGIRARYLEQLQKASTPQERAEADAWFVAEQQKLWNGRKVESDYRFNPSFLSDIHCMGNTRFAQLVRARGPNFQLHAACSSTTVAMGVAEDLIRSGRARRVIVLGADDVTSEVLLEWTVAGFLAAGAAATDADVADAALPFDRRRHGMVVGMGAVCLVLEAAGAVEERGMEGIAELLGTRFSNSAHHFTRPDPEHIAGEMERFLTEMEERHGLKRSELASQTVYLSHETFTPARNGIAEAEVHALKRAFGPAWKQVTVVNTKAITGHSQGAGIEDAIALKAMQLGKLPPVVHHRDQDPALEGLRLSTGGPAELEFAMRFSAGFGSQVAMSLCRVVSRDRTRIADRPRYNQWVSKVSGLPGAEVEVVNRTLRVREDVLSEQPPPPPSEPAVVAVASLPPPAKEDLAETVLQLVAEKTGYEREYLDLDLDLEADLGIDTIKQAQVLAALRERYDLPREEGLKIKDFPTLRHVIGYIAGRVGSASEPALADETTWGSPGVRRMTVTWQRCPLDPSEPAHSVRGWRILLTDDGRGVASALRRRLEKRGAKVVVLQGAEPVESLTPAHGLVHLAPLAANAAPERLDPAAWRRELEHVSRCFRLVQRLAPDLRLVAGVAVEGPVGGGIAGLLKSVGQERPEWRVKAITVSEPWHAEDVARLVDEEIEHGGMRVEAAYHDGVRLAPAVCWQPLDPQRSSGLRLDSSSVLLLIGGARGVTSEIARDLARRFRPSLVLVGSSSLPADAAQLAALDADGLQSLRRRVAAELQAGGGKVTPVRIEREFDRYRRAIEMQRTLEAVRQAGARVVYHRCDVRDPVQVRSLFASVQQSHGRIDGVVFAAGTIEDKLLEDKSAESFDRVFGVKAEGVFHVAQALDWERVPFFVAFSSVAGRFGNRGQCDYAAANDLLSRFTARLGDLHPRTRCVSMGWTAWERVGLAARSGVTGFMREQGFDILRPEDGAVAFRQELLHGGDDPEVLITGDVGPLDRDHVMVATPLLDRIGEHQRGKRLTAFRTLDPNRDPWLLDHVINGAPLLPGVMGIEMMVEAARLVHPGLHFAGLRDLRISLAVKVLKGRPVEVRVRAQDGGPEPDNGRRVAVVIESDVVHPNGTILAEGRRHYEATVLLTHQAPVPESAGRLEPAAAALAVPAERIYGAGSPLPHGALFRVLRGLRQVSERGAVGEVSPPAENAFFAALNGHRLQTLPLAREAAFQVAGLWELLQRGSLGLPYGCRRLEHFGYPPEGVRLFVRAAPRDAAGSLEYDIEVVGEDGRVYDRMEGYYAVRIEG